jgi:hypothetical protein
VTLRPSADSFIEGARDFIEAASRLIDSRDANTAVEPIGVLASHGVELALKAYLLQARMSADELRGRRFRHNLRALWIEAATRGLPIDPEPPYWLRVLNVSYDAPYRFRYRPEGLSTAIPHAPELRDILQHVLGLIERALRKDVRPRNLEGAAARPHSQIERRCEMAGPSIVVDSDDVTVPIPGWQPKRALDQLDEEFPEDADPTPYV